MNLEPPACLGCAPVDGVVHLCPFHASAPALLAALKEAVVLVRYLTIPGDGGPRWDVPISKRPGAPTAKQAYDSMTAAINQACAP